MTDRQTGPEEEPTPPPAPRWLVWMIPARHREDLLDDLREEYQTVAERVGGRRARRWFLRHLLRTVAAEIAARLRFRGRRRSGGWESVVQDARYARRSLARSRVFTVTATVTLALGIGATTAVFSVVDGVMIKPLPMEKPHRIVIPWETFRTRNIMEGVVSYPNLEEWRTRTRVFSGVAGVHPQSYTLTERGLPERITGARVTSDFFYVLGVRQTQGRLFLPEDDAPGAPDVVIASAGFWQRNFAGAPLNGTETLILDGQPFAVVGILPESFAFGVRVGDAELWTPAAQDFASYEHREWPQLIPVARLRDGVTLVDAQSDMDRVARELEADYPDTNTEHGANVVPLMKQVAAGVSDQLLVFLVAVALVLVVACLNVANLLLVRGAGRHRELGVRSALGAARSRVVRQLITEGFLLAALGGGLGVLLAWVGTNGLRTLLPTDYPRLGDIQLDARALIFAAVTAVGSCLLASLVPAILASRGDVQCALKEGTRATTSMAQRRLRQALVVGEVALSLMVLVGAGLIARSFVEMRGVEPGFDPDGVLTFRVATDWGAMNVYDRAAFYGAAVERITTLPGVRSAGAGTAMPLATAFRSTFQHGGSPDVPRSERPSAVYLSVTPSYFDALGIPLRRGAGFTGAETRDSPGVVLVNEAAARAFWPDVDPLGKVIRPDVDITDVDPTSFTVAGVVGDVRDVALDAAPRPIIYVPYTQQTWPTMTFAVRADGDPAALVPAMREIVNELSQEASFSFQRLDDVLTQSTTERRFITTVMVIFGVLALVLAAVGTFGVLSHSVTRRTHELGVRRALGADRGNVLRIVALEGGSLLAMGIALGLLGSVGVGRLVAGLLFATEPTDPLTYLLACGALGMAGLVAMSLPARRATQVDPVVALRSE